MCASGDSVFHLKWTSVVYPSHRNHTEHRLVLTSEHGLVILVTVMDSLTCQHCGAFGRHTSWCKVRNPLPLELSMVEQQLATGAIPFKLRWWVRKKGWGSRAHNLYQSIKGKNSCWWAASPQELIWAIERITTELAASPGITRSLEGSGRPIETWRQCPTCGRMLGQKEHVCVTDQAREANGRFRKGG